MPTATLSDGTNTITFNRIEEVDRRMDAQNFTPFGYPENEGQEVIFEGQWLRVFKFKFELKNDATYPGSGDSAADKRADFENLLFTGGVNEWLFTMTFDSEDSKPGAQQIESYDGKVKNLQSRSVAGNNVATIGGTFEFWEDNIS